MKAAVTAVAFFTPDNVHVGVEPLQAPLNMSKSYPAFVADAVHRLLALYGTGFGAQLSEPATLDGKTVVVIAKLHAGVKVVAGWVAETGYMTNLLPLSDVPVQGCAVQLPVTFAHDAVVTVTFTVYVAPFTIPIDMLLTVSVPPEMDVVAVCPAGKVAFVIVNPDPVGTESVNDFIVRFAGDSFLKIAVTVPVETLFTAVMAIGLVQPVP